MKLKSNCENKYFQILSQTNKNIPVIVSLLLIIKANVLKNEIFYLFAIFFRFLGLLIICGYYNSSSSSSIEGITISNFFRSFCFYGLIEKVKISNLTYLALSIVIFFLLIIIIFFYLKIIHDIKNKNKLEKISIFKIQIIVDHLIFLFFPYIIEFLSFIFYIEFNGDKFIIKKSLSSFLNMIIVFLNGISIIGYNIQSFFYILSINSPFDDTNDEIKFKYGRNKIIIISILQNIIIIESLVLYLNNNNLMIYTITINILLLIIFLILYLYYRNDFNYNTNTNYLINILSIFCFFSIIFEMISYFVGYTIESYVTLFFYTICKLIITLGFEYILNNIYEDKMINLLTDEIFKIFNDKNITENQKYNCFYYFIEMIKKIKDNKDNGNTEKLVDVILLHQSKCHHVECKCKYIEIFPYGKKYIDEYIKNLLERINFLFESTFVELDYLKNYDLVLLLSEHYYNYKNNPIFSYSMIQTVLLFNIKSLNINQILILYSALYKYIVKCNDIYENDFWDKNSEEMEKQMLERTKIKFFKSIFINYKYLMKVKKILYKYSNDILQLVKYKENMEETIQLVKDENNDIIKIESSFLTLKNVNNIKNILLGEFILKDNLLKYIRKLDANKIPIEMIYKSVLFSELFLCGKVPDEIMSLVLSINSDINSFFKKIEQNILLTLEEIFKKKSYDEIKVSNANDGDKFNNKDNLEEVSVDIESNIEIII